MRFRPPGPGVIRLRVAIEGDSYAEYRATVQTPEGREVLTTDGLRVAAEPGLGKVVEVSCDSKRLVPGDYLLRLFGKPASGPPEAAGGYAFRVVTAPQN